MTDGDLRRHITGLMAHTAGEVMTAGPKKTVPPTMLASPEALALMSDPPPAVTVLFVVDGGKRRRRHPDLHIADRVIAQGPRYKVAVHAILETCRTRAFRGRAVGDLDFPGGLIRAASLFRPRLQHL